MSRFWQTACLLQFVGVLLSRGDGVWWWVAAAALVLALAQLWSSCRAEDKVRQSMSVVVREVHR